MQINCPEAELIQIVEGCIMATKRSTTPANLLQQILSDADTYHLGTKEFKRTNKQVRKEILLDREMSKEEYDIKTLEFLENHKYYTSYCIELLNKGKEENIERLRQKITERTVNTDDNKLFGGEKEGDPKISKQASSLISKGIQTMLRLASQNNLRLSEMADRKANILISVNAIIISVSISVLFRKFETDPFLVVPTIIFLTSSVITIVLSILATRPTITGAATITANVKTMAAMTRKSIQVSESLLWRLAMVRVLFVELSTIASQCASEKVYGATLAPIPDLSRLARRRWMGRN
jgi:hypothetical protein